MRQVVAADELAEFGAVGGEGFGGALEGMLVDIVRKFNRLGWNAGPVRARR